MKSRKLSSLAAVCAAAALSLGLATSSNAAPVPYTLTIDPMQSFIVQGALASIDLGPPIGVLVLPIGPQAPFQVNNPGPAPFGSNGDKAFYAGTIDILLDAGTSIQFQTGVLDALVSSNAVGWAPEEGGGPVGPANATTEPADYGIELGGGLVLSSVREFVLDLTSGVLPLAGDNFASTQSLTATSGSLSYAGAIAPGSSSLVGLPLTNNAADGSVTLVGNLLTLTAPIQIAQTVDIDGTPVDLTFTGRIVATATVPEPGALALCGVAIAAVAPVRARRRASSR